MILANFSYQLMPAGPGLAASLPAITAENSWEQLARRPTEGG
jgi:hypothetical protein